MVSWAAEYVSGDGIAMAHITHITDAQQRMIAQYTVPAGVWRVGIVREYDAFAEEARRVRD